MPRTNKSLYPHMRALLSVSFAVCGFLMWAAPIKAAGQVLPVQIREDQLFVEQRLAEQRLAEQRLPSKLTVYAGPQSVKPRGTLYISVEAANINGQSSDGAPVTLQYQADGVARYVTKDSLDGLAVFIIPAQRASGLMSFSASSGAVTSNTARAIVTAGPPKNLQVSVRRHARENSVLITSNAIIDEYGNQITDLSLVNLSWLDKNGLIASQKKQLSNGRILINAPCPKGFRGPLKIQLNLKNAATITRNIAGLCPGRYGAGVGAKS